MEPTRGANFELQSIEPPSGERGGSRTWLSCVVWARPDLSRAAGAQLAETMAEALERACLGHDGVLLDFREATTAWGPATERAIGRMMRAAERACLPLVVLHSAEALQQIALRKLVAECAPLRGSLHGTLEDYRAQRRSSARLRAVGPTPRPPR